QITNAAELHSRVIVDPGQNQLTYYSCGSATYITSPGASKYWLRRLGNAGASRWNSKKIIIKAYRWLCEQYRPGDRIFLFGFSRGAYESRALAAMIEKVGLVNTGNQELIPLAYRAFLESRGDKSKDMDKVQNFRHTFSRRVKIHFIGMSDCVSPTGLVRGPPGPLPSSADHVCIVRHALALDERKVNLLSAYAGSDASPPPIFIENDESASADTKISTETKIVDEVGKSISKFSHKLGRRAESMDIQISEARKNPRDLKEVWFAGTHTDM
ncbi:hypothetical protein DFH07DRAFT_986247, partial [Mycena maculata]